MTGYFRPWGDPPPPHQHEQVGTEVTRTDLDNLKMDEALIHARMREDWQRELQQILKGFKNEMRLLIAIAVIAVKVQFPPALTATLVGAVIAKSVVALLLRH